MHVASALGYVPLFIIALNMWRRSRNLGKPIRRARTLLIPAFGIMTGLPFMLLRPDMHGLHPFLPQPWWTMLVAVLVGALFALPLAHFTRYERRADGLIYQQASTALLVAFVAIVVVRVVARVALSWMDPWVENALFFMLVVSYIFVWRLASYLKFVRVQRG
ncbi:cytochrome c biogenesis protein CcdC [Deinococcus maricopensis]|uniref:Uncharacterized protein n=1 Tax=Deinococcus maricopensis (strain DSM 21211 / LMG 22137 / NRRL B-23946 / LB-34) TaxID=709986 RepID=E8UAQ6_DEIML|nr:cytochrome c biogenesis protein CcdC [Deinococcus maricopensis]ADV68145.1 protein of unknown function DUF1453 [Deinococcus maricopensis DSM 21211]